MPDDTNDVTLDMSKSQPLTPAKPAGVKLDLSKSTPLAQAQEDTLRSTSPSESLIPPVQKPTVDMHYVNPLTGAEQKPLPKNFTERPIKSLPTDEQLEAAHRHMIETGTKTGREIGAGYVSGATAGPGGGFVVPQGPTKSVEELRKERPVTMGIAEGIGGTVGGQVADPVNWALALSGGAELPVLSKLASAAFAAKMGKDVVDGAKQLGADWDNLTPEERSERITQLGLSTIFAGLAGAHATTKLPEGVTAPVKDLITSEEGKDFIVPGTERRSADTSGQLINNEGTPSRRASDKSRIAPLVKREVLSHVPLYDRITGNKPPTIPELIKAVRPEEIPTLEQFKGRFTLDANGKPVFTPGQVKLDNGTIAWVDKEGNIQPTRRGNPSFRVIGGKVVEEPTLSPASAEAPAIIPVDTVGKGVSKSGNSPPAESLIPEKSAKPSPWATDADRAAQAAEQPLIPPSAKPGARYRGMERIAEPPAPSTRAGNAFSESGTSPPAEELIQSQPSATHLASEELIPTQPQRVTPAKLTKEITSEPDYVYHATNAERLQDIADSGRLEIHKPNYGTDQDTWPDSSTEKRSYFSRKADVVWQFAPEEGKPVVVRTKGAGLKNESTGDVFSNKPIKTDQLEYLGEDGKWHPVDSLSSKPTTPKVKPLIPEREPGLMTAGEEGREPAKSAEEYHPAVQQTVTELSDDNLRKLAKAHGLEPDEYDLNKRDAGRHRVERDQLAKEITEQMGEDEKINIGRAAENAEKEPGFENRDRSAKANAERAAKLFPRLRGRVDELGNPAGLEGMSPRELHQGLGFGERNIGVTKEEFEAAKKAFNDKATRSSAGLDPTMLVDAAKIAAYYFEGGVREFSAFSSQMIAKLGEAIRPHLQELYARAKAGVAPTWKGTAEEWTEARADVDARAARSAIPKGQSLPQAMGGAEPEPFQGKLTPSKLEGYTDPNGQFYKTVVKELQKTTTPDAARDLAQDVMADFTENVKDGKFKLPENPSEEGRVTANLKSIAHNKAADWADAVSGETASGAARKVLNTKRLSETATPKKGPSGPKLGEQLGEDEEVNPNRPEESKSPYGFGEEADLYDEHSNARRALQQYLEEHPETADEDKELLLSASKKGLEKAEAARSKAYDKEFARSGDAEKAIEAGRKAEARVNANKFTATDRYFGLTDADMTKLGQARHLTGTKFRARLTAIMDDLNSRAEKGIERPRTGPAPVTGDSYTRFLSGEGPASTGFGKVTTEAAPTAAKPSETYGNAEGFSSSQPRAPEPEPDTPPEFKGTREEAQEGTPRPLIETAQPLSRGGRAGITPIDLEGAAANRERLATQRVAEAEQTLSEATTPAGQRRARTELEDAKDRLNYLKALKQPVSGGSQRADVHAIASDYLKQLQRGGATITKIEAVIPEAGNIISGVQEEAQRFGVNLRNRGFEQPTEVEHTGKVASRLPRIAIGQPTETANLIPEATSPELDTEAKRILARREQTERAPTKEDQQIEQLKTIRERLGLPHFKSKVSPKAEATLGAQTFISKAPENIRTRALADYNYSSTKGDLLTRHTVTATNSKGGLLSKVTATEERGNPGIWTVDNSYAGPKGTGVGTAAYTRLLDEAARRSTAEHPITVQGGGVTSDSAVAVWNKLKAMGYDVRFDQHDRPSVTFTPKKPATSVRLPKSLGGSPSEPASLIERMLNK